MNFFDTMLQEVRAAVPAFGMSPSSRLRATTLPEQLLLTVALLQLFHIDKYERTQQRRSTKVVREPVKNVLAEFVR